MDNKSSRLTVLMDPAQKRAFEQLCEAQDLTPSQVTRRLIREFIQNPSSGVAGVAYTATDARPAESLKAA